MKTVDNSRLPKVLVCSINPWQDNSAIRTLIDIFSCWDKDKLANVYTKAGFPDTVVCDNFFRINENAVIKSVFKRSVKTSERVFNTKTQSDAQQEEVLKEQQRYSKTAKGHSWFMSLCRELVWAFGKRKTKELDAFLREFDPDVLFMPVYPMVYMSWIQKYIIKRTGKPVVCYQGDDNYSYASCGKNPLAYIHRFWLRMGVRSLMKSCNKLCVIVPKQKEEYDRIFNTDSFILTKAIDFSDKKPDAVAQSLPLRMVYTGKLIIGRDKALIKIAEALEEINKEELKIIFDVYSTTEPDEAFMKAFGTKCCRFKGAVEKSEVDSIQRQADIVVFAESLDKKYRNIARLSFSTKITDYFSTGRCIFALGDKDIAPIDYLIKEDAAITVTDYKDIEAALRKLSENPSLVSEYGEKAFLCGKRNHDAEQVFGNFKELMCSIAESK